MLMNINVDHVDGTGDDDYDTACFKAEVDMLRQLQQSKRGPIKDNEDNKDDNNRDDDDNNGNNEDAKDDYLSPCVSSTSIVIDVFCAD